MTLHLTSREPSRVFGVKMGEGEMRMEMETKVLTVNETKPTLFGGCISFACGIMERIERGD